MALPLPSVIPNTEAGGGLVTAMRGMNALQQSMLENKIKQAQAQYAPYTEYANAASKIAYSNLLPYEIQSKVLSNPMMWMALQNNPDAINAIVKNFQGAIPANGQIFGDVNLPPPGQYGNQKGLLNRLFDYLDSGNKQASPNPLATPSAGSQPINPLASGAGQDFGAVNRASDQEVVNIADRSGRLLDNAPSIAPGGVPGAINKMTAQYNQQPYDPGKTYSTSAGERSAAATENVAQQQRIITNVEQLEPVVKRIATGAERFLAPGKKGQVAASNVANFVEQYGGNIAGVPEFVKRQFGVTDQEVSEYAKWQSDIKTVVETFKNALNLPNDEYAVKMVESTVSPQFGEGKNYSDRILKQFKELQTEKVPIAQKTLRTGIDVTGKPVSQEELPEKPIKTGADVLSKKITLPSFKSKQEFVDWFNRQPAITQKAVREHLGNK